MEIKELKDEQLSKVTGGFIEGVDIELEDKVKSIIAEQCGYPVSMLELSAKLVTDLGYESLDFIDLIQGLEEEFKISIDYAIFSLLVTVEDVIKYVSDRTSPKL